MSTTVLTDEQIAQALNLAGATDYADVPLSYDLEIARAIEQAVLQSPEIQAMRKAAERYRWLRNPDQDVSLVLDKVVGETPMDEQGFGGYRRYEYRAGNELDAAIDAAMEKQP